VHEAAGGDEQALASGLFSARHSRIIDRSSSRAHANGFSLGGALDVYAQALGPMDALLIGGAADLHGEHDG
jgi:hypothetical protein